MTSQQRPRPTAPLVNIARLGAAALVFGAVGVEYRQNRQASSIIRANRDHPVTACGQAGFSASTCLNAAWDIADGKRLERPSPLNDQTVGAMLAAPAGR